MTSQHAMSRLSSHGEVPDAVEPTRQRVRATIGLVGGYWRPLAGVARLQEELGELAELDPHDTRRASELADLWIITTALCDQFLGAVAEPHSYALSSPASGERLEGEALRGLVAAAGRIARIVNYYDGPKAPRSFESWITLNDAVAGFHRSLARMADAHGIDLAAAIEEKLDGIPALDSGRFRGGEHDPATAASLKRFRGVHGAKREGESHPPLRHGSDAERWRQGSDAEHLRLWGSPEASPNDAAHVQSIAADLTSFTKASPWERLEGYVISGPAFDSTAPFEEWLTRLLLCVAACDPSGAQPMRAQAMRAQALLRPEPYFDFNGLRLLVSILEPHSAAGTFALLQAPRSTNGPPAP